jgi:hypothetical protein
LEGRVPEARVVVSSSQQKTPPAAQVHLLTSVQGGRISLTSGYSTQQISGAIEILTGVGVVLLCGSTKEEAVAA